MFGMQISQPYRDSLTRKIFLFLFSSESKISLDETRIGRLLAKIYLPYVTEVCLFLAVVLFWYEGAIIKYIPAVSGKPWPSVLIVIGTIFANKTRINIQKMHFWYLIFLLVSLFSGLLAITRGIDGKLILSGWLLFAQLGLAMLAAQSLRISKRINEFLVYASAPLAVVGLFQYFMHIKTPQTWIEPFEKDITTRAFAFFGSPNILGILLAVMTVMAIGLYFEQKRSLFVIIAMLDIWAVIVTFSRSAWIGLLIALIFIALIYKPKLIFYTPLVLLLFAVRQIRARMMELIDPSYIQDASLDGRIWSFQNGLYIFGKHVFWGSGPGTYGGQLALNWPSPVFLEGIQNGYTALYYTDNQFLEILVQLGILGSIAVGGFVISAINYLVSVYKEKRQIIPIFSAGALVCFIVAGLFANVLEFGAIAVPMGLILGSALNEA